MTLRHHTEIPEDTEILTGPRGGLYYMRNGKRVYLTDNHHKRSLKYTPPKRGAYARYLASQIQSPSPLENSHDHN